METHRTLLSPVTPADVAELFELCCSGPQSLYWRYRGTTPSPGDFTNSLWSGVVTQLKVHDKRSGSLIGLVVLHDDAGHHARVGAVFRPPYIGTGLPFEAVMLFIDFVFKTRPYLKIYFETSSKWFPDSAVRFLHEEAALRDFVYQDGALATVHLYSLYRSDWERYASDLRSSRNSTGVGLLSRAEFLGRVASIIGHNVADLDPELSPIDLGFDSLCMLEFISWLDDEVPHWNPPVPWEQLALQSLSEIHHLVSVELARTIDLHF